MIRSALFKLVVMVGLVAGINGCSERTLIDPVPVVERIKKGSSIQIEIDRLAQPLIENEENVGIVVGLVSTKHHQIVRPYGLKSLKEKIPMEPQTPFAIGSVTKSLVIALFRVLVADGVVGLHDPIKDILPASLVFEDENIGNITLFQLATHTSGLPREPNDWDSLMAITGYFFTGDNIYAHLNRESLYDFLSEASVSDEFPKKRVYSNIGIGLLGHLLSLKTGRSLDSLLTDYIYRPLNMQHTTINPSAVYLKQVAKGYVGDQPLFLSRNSEIENWRFNSVMEGSGGAYSNAHDLLQFLKAHLGMSNTRLDQILEQAWTGSPMGWDQVVLKRYGLNISYYHGMIAGFNCYIGLEANRKVAVVVLRNNFNWVDKIGQNLLVIISQDEGLADQDDAMSQNKEQSTKKPIG